MLRILIDIGSNGNQVSPTVKWFQNFDKTLNFVSILS
uniref:Uncharacterized protein n=1 Tax=Arundo donax TaxID=35708 RepID=A0A0A8YMM4_ARUDO